jgi:hypothetical protein
MPNRLEFQKANGSSVPVVFTDAQGTGVVSSFDSACDLIPLVHADREFARELWNLSETLTGIYFQTEDFALFCCAL